MRKSYNPQSLPIYGPISNIDLDVTQSCNLACIYCFKGEKHQREMSLDYAKSAIDWGLEAMQAVDCLYINFMGGEPLLRFNSLIVPTTEYGKRKAAQIGKRIQFSATTNLTLIDEEILNFWDKWGSGWLISIDGVPQLQDIQRPFLSGNPSSKTVETNALKVLKQRPRQAVRSTFAPQNLNYFAESVIYFFELGFPEVILAIACPNEIEDKHFNQFREEIKKISDYIEKKFKEGKSVRFRPFDYIIKKLIYPNPEEIPFTPMTCGAGRGMVMLDYEGNLWPCHRFDSAARDCGAGAGFCMGNIFGTFNHELHLGFMNLNFARDHLPECPSCPAYKICGFGCPASNLQDTGNLYKHHYNYCRIFRISYLEAKKFYNKMISVPTYRKHIEELVSVN